MLSVAGLATMPFGVAHAAAPELSVTDCSKFGGSGQAGTLGDALAQAAKNSGSAITFACDGAGPFTIRAGISTVSNTLTISSPAHNVTLDGGYGNRLFDVGSTGNLTLEGLTVARGFARWGAGAFIYKGGKLTIKDSTFTGNWAGGANGSFWYPSGDDGGGGGVYNNGGTLTIDRSNFSENGATGGNAIRGIVDKPGGHATGGGVYNNGGTLTISNSVFHNNTSTGGLGYAEYGGRAYGGGVYNTGGTLTISSSAFSDNRATGGKCYAEYGGRAYGGGVFNNGGALTISNSAFSGNSARGGSGGEVAGYAYGGGVYNTGGRLTITTSPFHNNTATGGQGDVAHSYGGIAYGGAICNDGGLTITNSAFSDNRATGGKGPTYGVAYGGGVYNTGGTLTISNSPFHNNTAGGGGGVWNVDSTLRITNSSFLGNLANQNDAWGGAVASTTSATTKTSIVSITNSSFIANASTGQQAHISRGGAIYSSRNTTLSITNSTVSANVAGISTGAPRNQAIDFFSAFSIGVSASGPTAGVNLGALAAVLFGDSGGYTSNGLGGGVYTDGAATITNSTFSGNLTVGSYGKGGGVYSSGSPASMTIKNSILAGNSADTRGMANCGGAVTDGGYNVVNWDQECGFTSAKHDVWTANARFENLGNNGGPAPTLSLLKDSLAVDQIPRGVNGCGTDLTTDQRGLTRPQGEKCDIGAFELDNVPPTTTASVSPRPNANGVYTADVKVTLSGGNDASGSGVKATYYKLDNGGQQTYTAPLSITSNGQHTLTYWSVDKAGNEEIAQVLTFKVDKTPYLLLYIGAGLAGILIIALIVGLVFWRRRKRHAGAGTEEIGEPSEERTPAGVR